MESLKAISEEFFIKVMFDYFKKLREESGLPYDIEYGEFLARESLSLHKEYWRLVKSKLE